MLRILSLGLGVQSTTLLLMSAHGTLPRLDAAIFADTQHEPSWVYETLAWVRKTVTTIPIHVITAGDLAADVLDACDNPQARTMDVESPPFWLPAERRGAPGRMWRRCTRGYKITPQKHLMKTLLGIPPGKRAPRQPVIEQWMGISVDELQRAGCSREPWIVRRYPLIEQRMRREDCLAWLRSHGYPEPKKSACLCCPYRSDRAWRAMRDETPDEWARAVAFDEALRAGGRRLPGTRGSAYVHKSLVPLALVDLDATDRGQADLFARHECAGVCGV